MLQRDAPNRIGWALREYDSDNIGNSTTWVGKLGQHTKVGYFNLYLWSNGTTTFEAFKRASSLKAVTALAGMLVAILF